MRAGLVILAPGESVGRHNTNDNEELIVVLEGEGLMVSDGGRRTLIGVSQYCYCPPHTGHDVVNTGRGRLRYVYVVARTD